jgi:hypothetical protein
MIFISWGKWLFSALAMNSVGKAAMDGGVWCVSSGNSWNYGRNW